ncbi:hypothetical protein J6590_004123 [Homalodisca vitripennis]|nr:hypothetical protein J6590_004123 [Homalodisca vitripennis]
MNVKLICSIPPTARAVPVSREAVRVRHGPPRRRVRRAAISLSFSHCHDTFSCLPARSTSLCNTLKKTCSEGFLEPTPFRGGSDPDDHIEEVFIQLTFFSSRRVALSGTPYTALSHYNSSRGIYPTPRRTRIRTVQIIWAKYRAKPDAAGGSEGDKSGERDHPGPGVNMRATLPTVVASLFSAAGQLSECCYLAMGSGNQQQVADQRAPRHLAAAGCRKPHIHTAPPHQIVIETAVADAGPRYLPLTS